MINSGTQKFKTRELRPQWARKNSENITISKINKQHQLLNQIEKDKKKRFLESDDFEKNYSLPFNLYDEYINKPWFDLKPYLNKNIERQNRITNSLYNRSDELYDCYVSNYKDYVHNLDENSMDFDNFYYLDSVFIDESMDRAICDSVIEKLKEEFGNDYFNPYN